MRLELALIVGILFFCSWCAYIIVKMNSSVSAPVTSPNQNHSAYSSSLQPLRTLYGRHHAHLQDTYTTDLQAARANESRLMYQAERAQHQVPSRISASSKPGAEASAPQAYYPGTRAGGQAARAPYSSIGPARPASGGWQAAATSAAHSAAQHALPPGGAAAPSLAWPRDYSATRAAPEEAWRPRSAPPHHHRAGPHYWTGGTGAPHSYQATVASHGAYLPAANRWRPTIWPPSAPAPVVQSYTRADREQSEPDFSQASADQDPNPDAPGGPGEELDETADDEAAGQTNDEGGPVNREVEEQVGRRSFSEDESDSNERDRDGNIVSRRHKHLINGRPVESEAASNRSGDEVAAASSKVAQRRRHHLENRRKGAADFEKVANEIDEENRAAAETSAGDDSEDTSAPYGGDNGNSQQQPEAGESRRQQVVRAPSSSVVGNAQRVNNASKLDRGRKETRGGGGGGRMANKEHLSGGKQVAPNSNSNSTSKPLVQSRVSYTRSTSKVKNNTGQKDNKRDESEGADGEDGEEAPAPKGESHEHRLKESLTAQRWDDDATSPGAVAKRQGLSGGPEDESSGDAGIGGDEENAGDSDREADEPPVSRQVDSELKDLDLMMDPSRFMDGSEESRRRRKRQAEPRPPEAAGNEQAQDERQAGVELVGPPTSVQAGATANMTNFLFHSTGPPPPVAPERRTAAAAAGGPSDGISGQEVVNVDVYAPPPAGPLSPENLHPFNASDTPPPPESPDPYGHQFYDAHDHQQQQQQQPQSQQEMQYQDHNSQEPGYQSNGHSPGQQQQAMAGGSGPPEYYSAPNLGGYPVGGPQGHQHEQPSFALTYPMLPSGSKHKKKVKRFKKSKLHESKYKASQALAQSKKSKSRKGGRNKKGKKAKKKFAKTYKEFDGHKRGKKRAKGGGQQGGNKGALYYKDKGYKKRGFKKAYQKLETGDHKMYFDEFRDKDHNKKWKNFKDKHHYSQSKDWSGKDKKRFKNYHLKELKDKKYGTWRDKAASKHKHEHKSASGSSYSKKKKMKKKSKKKKKKKKYA